MKRIFIPIELGKREFAILDAGESLIVFETWKNNPRRQQLYLLTMETKTWHKAIKK